jgi:glycerate 2-kinase
MKILIAPDKFKGSLNAQEAAENIAAGLRESLPEVNIDIVPMADGGEGTAEVISQALGAAWLQCKAHDPLGREIDVRYAWVDPPPPRLRRDRQRLAVMEMSEAAGLRRLSSNERDPLRATTFGVGEMILDASRHGATEIIIGLGGSATNDGGSGTAKALGFRFDYEHEQEQKEERECVTGLVNLNRIEKPRDLKLPRIIAAVDVRNPLLGKNGATRVFGPQKGVTPDKIDTLERALAKLADIVSKDLKVDYRDKPGAGAAGGLGFGLMSFCGAKIRPGFDVVAEVVGLESKTRNADIVITGEGSLDRQTLEGKTPAGVARLARKLGKRVFTIVGRASKERQVREIFDGVYELNQPGINEKEQMARTGELLRENARELGEMLKKTSNAQRRTRLRH